MSRTQNAFVWIAIGIALAISVVASATFDRPVNYGPPSHQELVDRHACSFVYGDPDRI